MNVQQLDQYNFEIFSENNFLEKTIGLMDERVVIFENPTGKEMHGVDGYIRYLAEVVNIIPDLKSRVIEHQFYEDKVMSRLQMRGSFTGTLQTREGIFYGNGNPIDIEYQIEQQLNPAGKVRQLTFNYDLPDFIDQLSRRYRPIMPKQSET